MSFLELLLATVVIALIVTVFALIINNKAVPGISCDDDAVDLLRKGERLQAMKAYRQLHGVGVKEAKKIHNQS